MVDALELRRGDVVLMRKARGDFLTKPRPVVVVQCNACLELRESITVCLLTKSTDEDVEFRPVIKKTAANGLDFDSTVEIDKLATLYRENIVEEPKGRISSADMKEISEAIAFWLGLS